MAGRIHLLEIYDLDDYQGPNPVRVTGRGTVHGPEATEYYVVEPLDSVVKGDQQVTQFALRPHYNGDDIQRAVESVCTVGIALAQPGCDFVSGDTYGFCDFSFWKVGKIQPDSGD